VNGIKKWITGGSKGDFFVTAVRTGETGGMGISLLLIPRNSKGLKVRRMDTQFDSSHSTTMVTLEDVRVPKRFLIGEENCGFLYILENFNHERWVIAAGSCRSSRECYREAFEWASKVCFFGTNFKDALFIFIIFY
jgi:alkylation response protein AidB-like acyl-CoA dehydrogenase